MAKRKTTEQFIQEAKEIHGNEFSYNDTKYINNATKVKIICKIHGMFEMLPNSHIIQKSKCPACYGNKKKTTESFIHDAVKCHGDKFSYDYTIYKNNSTKILIKCNICSHEFKQLPSMHLQGQGCPACYGNKKISSEEFYNHVNKLYNNYYSYVGDFKSLRENITVVCPEHGQFAQKAQSHYNGHKCQKCAKAGFDKTKDSYFYVQEIFSDSELIGYKFGITNNTPEHRMKVQSYHTSYKQKIIFSLKDNGNFIYNLEKHIKTIFKNCKLSKDEFGDGYTETISDDFIELLESEIIEFIIKSN